MNKPVFALTAGLLTAAIATPLVIPQNVIATPADDTAAARELVEKVTERYRALRSYQDVAVVTPEIKLAEGEEDNGFIEMMTGGGQEQRMNIAWKRGNVFAVGSEMAALASDGSRMTCAFLAEKQYRTMDCPESDMLAALESDIIAAQAAQHPLLPLLLNDDSGQANMATMLKKATELREGKIGDDDVHILIGTMTAPGAGMDAMPVHFYIDKESNLVRRAAIDMTQMFTEMDMGMPGQEMPKIASAMYVLNFKDIKVDEEVPADMLAIDLDGFKEVEEFDFGMGGQMEMGGLEVGTEAPSFQGKTLTGETFSISDLRGKVVLLDFWATWCGPCVAAIPSIQKISEEFAGKGLVVIGINEDRGNTTLVSDFVEKNKITFEHVMDADGSIASLYEVPGFPTTVLIDGEGKVLAFEVGFKGEDALRAMIEEALGK